MDFGEHGRCTSTWVNFNVFSYQYFSKWAVSFIGFFGQVVGDPGIEPGVRLREGVTVPCHTLRPVAHLSSGKDTRSPKGLRLRKSDVNQKSACPLTASK